MGKHGAGNPAGNMFPRETADNYDPSQVDDHTAKMNSWFAASFKNLLMPSVVPLFELAAKVEDKRVNEVIMRTNRELAHLHKQVAILAEVVKRSMTADWFQQRMHEVSDELDIKVKFELSLYGDDDKHDEALRAESDAPTIFKVITKTKPSDTDDTEPTSTVQSQSWLRRIFG